MEDTHTHTQREREREREPSFSAVKWENNRLVLDGKLLKESNNLEVHYTNEYDHHGEVW